MGSMAAEVEPSYLAERQSWLVRLRWIAVAGVSSVVLLADHFRWAHDPRPLLVIAAFMAAANATFAFLRPRLSHRHEETLLGIQILSDITALTLLLHWSGGIENPFSAFYVFPVTLAAMLLSTRRSYAIALSAFLFYGTMVTAEFLGIFPHEGLSFGDSSVLSRESAPRHSPAYLAGHLIAFATMLLGVVFFVRSVETWRFRAAKRARERERIALSRERMARIGQISAGVSHSIRNPLQGVLNCLELLRTDDARDGDQEVLDMMWEGVKRIEGVTRRLLSLSPGDKPQRRMVDPRELLEESCRFVQRRRGSRLVQVDQELRDMQLVWLDPDQLGEALTNLIDNAVFACRERGKVVLRAAVDGVADAPRLVIEIQDDGEGIPAGALPEVFDPFYTTKAIGEGTGLGMAIARSVVERHGGDIDVTSREGEGTLIRLSLPILKPHLAGSPSS